MSRATKILAGAAAVALGLVGSVKASTLTITPTVTAYWASDASIGNPSEPIVKINGAYPKAGAYRIDYAVASTLTGAENTAGFTGLGNLAFDINGAGGAGGKIQDVGGGWLAAIPSVRTAGDGARYVDPITNATVPAGGAGNNSNLQRVPLFTDDSDIGASTTDLKFIYADVGQLTAFSASDPRVTATTPNQNSFLTQASGNPMYFGTIIVHYDGTAPAGTPAPLGVGFGTGEGYSLHNNTTTLHGPVTTVGASGTSVLFGTVPEPTGLALLSLGAVAALRRRRA